jgi:type II secretory pathway pseudopilin PulG
MTSTSTLARVARLGSTRKRGVTLIEAVLYISIALALIVGGLVFFQQASLAQRTNSAVRNISAIASETRGLYQQVNSFGGFDEGALINAGAVPTSLIDTVPNPDQLKNEWGGRITAGTNAAALPAVGSAVILPINAGFCVIYPNLPTAACVRLTTTDASGSGRVGSGIRSIAFAPAGGAYGNEIPPGSLDPSQVAAAALCGQAGGVVDVRFTFNR